ncbi:MAG: hypothetical protein ACXVIJ_01650, partial [Thermoanaerobaculia bacterium]
MAEFKTSRPFEERFLNGYDRSQLRQEVQKAKRMKGLKKKYATWALGASLAFGGIGAPLKMIHDAKGTAEVGGQRAASEVADTGITGDLQQAKSIAEQVAGGVQAAAQGVES